jgi:hypothetical protein
MNTMYQRVFSRGVTGSDMEFRKVKLVAVRGKGVGHLYRASKEAPAMVQRVTGTAMLQIEQGSK